MTLANHCLDRNHLRGVSGVDVIELESEHKNTTSAGDAPDARGMLLVQVIGAAFEISFTVLL